MSTTTETKHHSHLEKAIATVDENNAMLTNLLSGAIAFEQNKTLKDIAVSYCHRFEALFDRVYGYQPDLPEDAISYEEMDEYCVYAKFMFDQCERKHHHIQAVKEQMQRMDIDSARRRNQASLFENFRDLKV